VPPTCRPARARQVGGCIEVGGLPQDRAQLNGRYRREGSAGGRAAYKNRKGKHLFWHPELDEWHLSSNPYDPAKTGSVAYTAARGGPVPTGARAWSVFTGEEDVDVELTMREVGAEEAAAMDAADEADAERQRLEEAAQADRVVRRPVCPRWARGHTVIPHCHWAAVGCNCLEINFTH
jgi:hypothetical protein